MTHSKEAEFVENEESGSTEDWSSVAAAAPTAPSEMDVMMYGAMEEEYDPYGTTSYPAESRNVSGVVDDDREFPPALPVAVMDTSHPPSSPVLYDYQRDLVFHNPSFAVTEDFHDFEVSYRVPLLRHEGTEQPALNLVVEDMPPSTAVASGVAGAVVGTLVLGTLPGIMAGLFAAYAHGQSGTAGDISKALGEIALITREKALAIDRKHNLVARGKVALTGAWENAKDLDRQHHVVQRLKEFSMFAWTMTLHFIRRNSCPSPPQYENRSRVDCSRQRNDDRYPAPVSSALERRPAHREGLESRSRQQYQARSY